MPRRLFYTRKQIAEACDVSVRHVTRWEGRYLTRLKDPTDPSGRRVLYDGSEVEAFLRRRQRMDKEGQIVRRPSSTPPRPRARDGNAQRGSPVGGATSERDGIPPSKRLAPRSDRDEPASPPPSNRPRPRDEIDDIEARWNREMDERKARWGREHADGPSNADEAHENGDDDDDGDDEP